MIKKNNSKKKILKKIKNVKKRKIIIYEWL